MVFFTIELQDAAVEFFASRFKRLSELSDHVAVEHFTPILRRENKVNHETSDAMPSSPIAFLRTHLSHLIIALNLCVL